MSGDRQTDNFAATDQASRAAQAETDEQEEQVQTEESVIESMRRQLAELEERDRAREAEIAAERRHLTEERSRRERAEAAAREADSRAAQATDFGTRSVEEARLSEIRTALDARKGQMEALKSQYQAAFAEGDGGKMASVNSDMALVGAQITSLEAGKIELEQRQAAATQTQTQTRAPPTPDQAREQMMQGLNSRERDWIMAHPEYFDDQAFQRRVQRAAGEAQDDHGYSRDSQQYIDFINQKLGFAEPPPSPPPRQERQTIAAPRGREANTSSASDRRMVAAPAGGSVPNVSRGTDEPIYLTAQEKELARMQGIPEGEYAKHKRDLLREGLIGPGAANRR